MKKNLGKKEEGNSGEKKRKETPGPKRGRKLWRKRRKNILGKKEKRNSGKKRGRKF